MNDPIVIASAVVIIVGTFVTGIVSILNAIAANTRKQDVIISKAEEIHTLTNSNLSEVKNDLHVALEKIKVLENLILQMSKTSSP